jgi:hypothetical protein
MTLLKLLSVIGLSTICVTAMSQTLPKNASWHRVDTLIANFGSDKKMGNDQIGANIYSWSVHTEMRYTYSDDEIVAIQNSGPRGGLGFTDSRGTKFGYRIFCTGLVNEGTTAVRLRITFPSDSFPLSSPDSYMKVFFLPDSMKHPKEATPEYDERMKSSYESVLHDIPTLQRTIQPKEAYLFRVVVLRHYKGDAQPRAGFFLDGQRLLFRIAPEFKNQLIPCGMIEFLN